MTVWKRHFLKYDR
jgi:hypothetical protein